MSKTEKVNEEQVFKQALDDDELETVAGGRNGLRESERRDHTLVLESVIKRAHELRAPYGHSKEADELESRYHDAYEEWIAEIKMAPEKGPDILFSDFFKF